MKRVRRHPGKSLYMLLSPVWSMNLSCGSWLITCQLSMSDDFVLLMCMVAVVIAKSSRTYLWQGDCLQEEVDSDGEEQEHIMAAVAE
mmetsp:Transcript_100951/g.231507  ORF Transcript_100951/g.231507 Transcript_100951/m.231507 type:complete len:87 (-) Transcript_100951:123-383(-)